MGEETQDWKRFNVEPGLDRELLRVKDVDAEGLGSLQAASLAPELRVFSFWSAGVEDARVLQALRDLCASGLAHESEFVDRAREALAAITDENGNPVWDPTQPDKEGVPREKWHKDVRNLCSAARLRLIFRTQRELAQGYQMFLSAFQPYALKRWPGWRFVRRAGAKTRRKDHELHRNEVRLKVDIDYWLDRNRPEIGGFNLPYWPFGFNSWMWVEQVEYDECVRRGLLREGQEPPEPPHDYDPYLYHVPEAMGKKGVQVLDETSLYNLKERMEEAGLTVGPKEPEKDPHTWEVLDVKAEDPWQRAEREAQQDEEKRRRKEAEREERLNRLRAEREERVRRLREEQERRARERRPETPGERMARIREEERKKKDL